MQALASAVVVLLALAGGAPVVGQSEVPPASEPRAIDLEMVGVGRFLRDGEEVRELNVVPGETVVFRVENAVGAPLGFEVGNADGICDPAQSPRWTVPAWTAGVRELTWTVPRGAAHLRWGHANRHCRLGAFSVGSESPNDRTPPEPRASGRLNTHLAHSAEWISFEADFQGPTSAVAWRENDDPWMTLYLSRSDDTRLRDFATQEVATDVEDESLAICAEDVVAGYLQAAPADGRGLWLARIPRDGGAASRIRVRAPIGKRGTIDVACTGARAYVAWTERVDGEWQAFVRSIALPTLQMSGVHAAGPAQRYRITVAATDDGAVLAWQEGQHIRLQRLHVDASDHQALVSWPVDPMAVRGKHPILAAHGDRVALGFDRGDRAFILTSRDGGRTFDRRTRFDRPVRGGPNEIDSLAIRGPDVVATMLVYYGGDAWDRHRLRSEDGGRTWTRSRVGHPFAAIPRDGFLLTTKGVKVAEAYTDGEYADTWDLRVRRVE